MANTLYELAALKKTATGCNPALDLTRGSSNRRSTKIGLKPQLCATRLGACGILTWTLRPQVELSRSNPRYFDKRCDAASIVGFEMSESRPFTALPPKNWDVVVMIKHNLLLLLILLLAGWKKLSDFAAPHEIVENSIVVPRVANSARNNCRMNFQLFR